MDRIWQTASIGQRLWVGTATLLLCAAFASADAQIAPDYNASPSAIGGLTHIPKPYRYHPPARPLQLSIQRAESIGSRLPISNLTAELDDAYHPDRRSLINTIRARRGLAFLTFWESADRCLFFGINDHGVAGFSYVATRRLGNRNKQHARYDADIESLYRQRTQGSADNSITDIHLTLLR